MTVTGHMIRLDDIRIVFVGTDTDQPSSTCIAFRAKDGRDLKLSISKEAAAALRSLLNGELDDTSTVNFPDGLPWHSRSATLSYRPRQTPDASHDAGNPATPPAAADPETSSGE